MNKSFKGKYIPFLERLAKKLAPIFLVFLICLLKIFYGRAFSGSLSNYRIHFVIVLCIASLVGIYYTANKVRTVVNEIILSENSIRIIGQDFTSKYEDSLDINKVILEIQEEELGKNKTRFCLEIYADDKYYYLNKFNDWQYETLVAIVDEYQSQTGKMVMGMEFYELLKN